MADLQDVPVTVSERIGLSALAPLAGVLPSGLTPGGGKTGRPIVQANIQLELPEFDPQKSARMGRRICRVPFVDWPIPCGCGHQMFTAKPLMQKEIFAKTGETDCENLFYLGRGTPEVRENIAQSMRLTSAYAHRSRSYLCSRSFHPLRKFFSMCATWSTCF